jgi:hypothetical protein
MRGSEIVLSVAPKGTFKEVTILGTPYPGQMMEICAAADLTAAGLAAVAAVGGRPVAVPLGYLSGATGDPRPLCLLCPDSDQGQAYSTAYVSGARGFVYFPIAGEEVNVAVAEEAGTGSVNAFKPGDRLVAQAILKATSATTGGQFIPQGTSSSRAQVRSLEHYDATVGPPTTGPIGGWLFCEVQ